MRERKICIVTDAWHPQINGVVTTLSRTVTTLQKWGHDVRTITPEGFSTLPCPTYPDIRLSFVTPATIGRIIQDFSPDAIHIATEGPLGWMTRAACKKNGFFFTTSYHTRFPEYIRLRIPFPLAWSYRIMLRFHGDAVRTLVAPTLFDEMKEKKFKNLVVWSRGVDTELFKPRGKKLLSLPRPVFLYTGRVAVEKNLPAFLDLELPGSKVVVGDGPAREALEKKYPQVLFTGAKKGVALARHIDAADVFVFPSLTDTFGVVLLEALACGVPVAAFPVTGPKYIITNGINGYVHTDLRTAALEALKLNPLLCRRFSQQYTWEICTGQFFSNLAWQSQ